VSDMIPFGKYKGQPIEVLENDPQYADWLAQQPWAKERYPQIVNIIINKFGENEETPDHNVMQAKFMDKRYCTMLAELLGAFDPIGDDKLESSVARLKASKLTCTMDEITSLADLVGDVHFEVNAIDVAFRVNPVGVVYLHTRQYQDVLDVTQGMIVKAELKPVIGDDYPAVLRQMRSNGSSVLLYTTYAGQGVDESTFKRLFETQKIRAVAEHEIEQNWFTREVKKISEVNRSFAFAKNLISLRVTAGDTTEPHFY